MKHYRYTDYFFIITGHFVVIIPAVLIDSLSDYVKSLLLTPKGDRLKVDECVSHNQGGSHMVDYNPLPLLQEIGDKVLNPTKYLCNVGNGLGAVYEMDGEPVLLPVNQLEILPDIWAGKATGARKPVIFEGEAGIMLLICPLLIKDEQQSELNALVSAIIKNKESEGVN
jgi:hypothetical protein